MYSYTFIIFFSSAVAGHHGTTTTKVLDASKIPQTYTLPPPDLERRNLLSAQHTHVNAVTDSEVSTLQHASLSKGLTFVAVTHVYLLFLFRATQKASPGVLSPLMLPSML